ncbi:thiol-activated cytolysin family protein [Haloarcula sp. S1AR25-4]|uniref:thiol-activated cytolysin family protein n=1 Tax=Haloarcula sp. S1AR25-4 TaxID=2950538 RepID=UPI00287BC94E|nr:thiol-activated cytolysin family protein [Halomicroarcula sp. S1AR25-4]
MTDDEPTMSRRRLLATAAAVSAGGLAGCTISTPFGDFGASTDDDSGGRDSGGAATPSPTPVTTTRQPSTRTTTPTPTDSPTAVPTSTPTAVPTATPTTNQTDLQPLTPDPCVMTGSCVSTPEPVETVTISDDPIFIPDDPILSPDIVLDPTLVNTTDSTLGEPSSVEEGGDLSVTVTPETNKAENTALGGTNTERNGDMICTTQRRQVTSGSGTNFLLDPQIGTIWPGAILEAESIARGQFSPALSSTRRNGVPASQIRNPLELSISLRNIDGQNTRKLQTPSLGSFRTALDDILGQYDRNANTPAKMNFSIHQIHSSKQLDVTLGAHYDSLKLQVDNEFDFSTESETNKIFAQFYQQYYSVDVSLPNPIANGVVSDQGAYLKPNDVVVKNVSYGRLLLFSAESKYERTDIENALNVALNAGSGRATASLDIKHKQVLRDTQINVQVLGGSAQQGAQTVSKPGEGAFEAIRNFIQDGATYDPKTSPGVPIAYQTKYLSNLDTANTYLTTSYTERNCRPTTRGYRVHNMSLGVIEENDPGNEEELYGDVYVVAWPVPKGSQVVGIDDRIEPKGGRSDGRVWHRSKSSNINVTQGSRKDLGVDATIEFDDAHDLDNSRTYIQVTAVPHERDPTSGDEFGNKKAVKWFLNEPPSDPDRAGREKGKFRERWNDRNSEIELAFDISPVPL